ncbi:MAG: ATP-binding protein, partial [Chloroflexota bacterium]
MDSVQVEANIALEQALRRASLLSAAAEVSQNITQITDIDVLLPKTVDIICDAYDFYYAGVFLIDEAGEFAVLRAGRGKPGQIMMENHHKLAVGGNSMIGACTALNEARISLDVDTEKVWYPNPVLPKTRSEMALPLATQERVIGAVTVQSVESAAFSNEDISSLQAMANQLAIAIENARQRRELEETHAQLLQAKTFAAIATATGDAIHWIGNKAEPIDGSINRVREDIELIICSIGNLLKNESAVSQTALSQLIISESDAMQTKNPKISQAVEKLNSLSPEKLENRLSSTSIMEDLQIVKDAGRFIMKIKEELIGPAREQAPRPIMLYDIIKDTLSELETISPMTTLDVQGIIPLVLADPVQSNRVFVNLLNNAYEAMGGRENPEINIAVRHDHNSDFVLVDVIDNGIGIAESDLDKIWITFNTTKGSKGQAGLGLPACRLILQQIGGRISVTSQPGEGSTFTISLPVYNKKEGDTKVEPGRGKLLLIDDDDRWRQFAFATLEANGYQVTLSDSTILNNPTPEYEQYNLILIDDILEAKNAKDIMAAIKEAGAIVNTIAVSSNPRVERAKER